MDMYPQSKFHLNESCRSGVRRGEGGGGLLNTPWVKVCVKNILGGRGLKDTGVSA